MPFQADSLIRVEIVSATAPSELLSALERWQEKGLLAQEKVNCTVGARKNSADEIINLQVNVGINLSEFLAELSQWQARGWLDEARISLTVAVKVSHPTLLEGLDAWLQLGLLSDFKVRQLCEENLSCILPPVTVAPKLESIPVATQLPTTSPPQRLPKRLLQSLPAAPRQPKPPSRFRQISQSLMAELSVLWLLLLGVFLVVVSSGVLAANFWEKFPPAGQYGVLWLYTLAFWGASFWSSRQTGLRLTTQALRLVTLLLVPMNFLAMDSLRLWRTPLNWLIVVLAAVSLTRITVQLFQAARFSRNLRVHLGLSYLHWGWAIPSFPLVATYLGVVGTAFMQVYHSATSRRQEEAPQRQQLDFSLNEAVVVYALSILLVRAIFIAQVEIGQLGLALGICGWLATWQKGQSRPIRELIGRILLLLGWMLSVIDIPGQALGVSGLAILFFARRLCSSWKPLDLTLLLLIGLQGWWLLWRLLPLPLQQGAIAFGTGLTGSEATPWALLSLVLFPYLIVILVLTNWFSQLGKRELANSGNAIALFFGTTLTVLSLVNPDLRTLNLAASTVALATVSQQQVQRSVGKFPDSKRERYLPLAYLTHIAALLTLAAAIDWAVPTLSLGVWGGILVVLMVLELALSVQPPISPTFLLHLLHQTTWNLGLSLAALSYSLFLLNQGAVELNLMSVSAHPVIGLEWGFIWGFVPLALTGVGTWNLTRREFASRLSVATLFLWQWLTLQPWFLHELGFKIAPNFPIAFLGLGIATGLMLLNTRNLQQSAAASITIGFGLSWLALCLWDGSFGWALRQEASWLLAGAIATLALWGLRHWLKQLPSDLAALYARAGDGWAIALCSLDLLILTINPWTRANPFFTLILSLLLMAATFYRSWQFPRSPIVTWLSIATLFVAQIPLLGMTGARSFSLAAATGFMLLQTLYLRQKQAVLTAVGFALALLVTILWDSVGVRSFKGWLLTGCLILILLWLLRSLFLRRQNQLTTLYAQALDAWAIALCGLELLALTVHSLAVYWNSIPASSLSLLVAAITLAAIAYRTWPEPNNWSIYGIGWSLELLMIEVLGLTEQSLIALAIANTLLGLLSQIIGDWWHRHSNRPEMLNSWHILPLLYGALGSALRWGVFSTWAGWSSLGLVLIAIGVGRRSEALKPLLYLGMLGASLSAYELLSYEISGLAAGDRLVAMAALAASFVYAYQLLSPWLAGYLHLTLAELKAFAHIHWALGSLFLLVALLSPIAVNKLLGLGVGIVLTRYAIWQGRKHPNRTSGEIWVYLGILEASGVAAQAAITIPAMGLLSRYLTPWLGISFPGIAIAIYLLPWKRWGWSPRPWQVVAMLLPSLAILPYLEKVNEVSLLAIAGFYAWLAQVRQQPRYRYFTLGFVGWAIARWLAVFALATPLAYSSLAGASFLCLVWIEPTAWRREAQPLRHRLRLLGTGIICGAALLFHHQTGILPGIVSLVAIFAGLALRIRAFLYLGTVTFLANAFYQLVILIFFYPLLKWLVGLLVGISLLWIAGSFETRRAQLSTLVQNWLGQLNEWE